MIIAQIILWISALSLIYTYIVYPLLLKVLSRNKTSNVILFTKRDDLPSLSILIPAYNEEKVIEEKINSVFKTNYPLEKMEVFVGSDASTDNTDAIVKSLQKKYSSLTLILFSGRSGKASIVNQLVEKTKNEILLLTDANVILHQDAIFEMLKHFKNPEIALVDSNMQHLGLKKKGISRQEETYIKGEVAIKNAEGKIWGSMMGPFGGCFALRRNFYSKIPSNSLVDDFYLNMKVFEKGGKAINETNALVYEDVSSILREEFRRKIRIASGNFQNLFRFFPLLFKFNAISFCFLSHKVLRWLGPFFILLAFGSNFYLVYYLLQQSIACALVQTLGIICDAPSYLVFYFYLFTFLLQSFIFIMPIVDFVLNRLKFHPLFPRLVSHFLSMNLALLIGFFRFMKGVRSGVWAPTQRKQ